MALLEKLLEEKFDELGITKGQRNFLKGWLNVMKTSDVTTYEHSIRVGLLGAEVATFIDANPNAFLYVGLMHDMGKLSIDEKVLKKSSSIWKDFTKEDFEQMKDHPLFGYYLLKKEKPLEAEISLTHHRHQGNAYPADEDLPKSKFVDSTRVLIAYYSRILSLIDQYETMTYRLNKKSLKENLTPEEKKKKFIGNNDDLKTLINHLYDAGIFGNGMFKNASPLKIDEKYKICLPEIEGKNAVFAGALEPLYRPDMNLEDEFKTIEEFIAKSLRVGTAFVHLSKYLEKNKSPAGIYRYLYEAQMKNEKDKFDGEFSPGMIEFLLPLVAAHTLYDPRSEKDPDELFEKGRELLKLTTKQDVKWLIKMKELANKLSGKENKYRFHWHKVNNVLEYYETELDYESEEGNLAGIVHNSQFTDSFQDIKLAFDKMQKNGYDSFTEKIVSCYKAIFKKKNYKGLDFKLAADLITAAVYLHLSYNNINLLIRRK